MTNQVEAKAARPKIPPQTLVKTILQVATSPSLAWALLNAQLRISGKAQVPLSVQLDGRIRLAGRGQIVFGQGVSLIGNVVPIEMVAHKDARIEIGDDTFINYGSSITAHEFVSIGRNCLLGHYTMIMDNDEHEVTQHYKTPPSRPVTIEDNVWIGSRAIILPGVHIGGHSVIGAGSIVTKDVPPYCLAVGNPARVIRRLDEQDDQHLALA